MIPTLIDFLKCFPDYVIKDKEFEVNKFVPVGVGSLGGLVFSGIYKINMVAVK